METTWRRARATVNLPGLPLGQTAWVDAADDYMRDLIATECLVLVEEPNADPAPASDEEG